MAMAMAKCAGIRGLLIGQRFQNEMSRSTYLSPEESESPRECVCEESMIPRKARAIHPTSSPYAPARRPSSFILVRPSVLHQSLITPSPSRASAPRSFLRPLIHVGHRSSRHSSSSATHVLVVFGITGGRRRESLRLPSSRKPSLSYPMRIEIRYTSMEKARASLSDEAP
ncbi:hypothetical protein SCHPADRAFT_118406 [Schizopora paradoxa]|uniref:Uncharacterized protein n=1 Tax=Schizopora paradoxa TaxID=27342 RepID=A0A0H2S2B9_9AGAM|nr:hypothetical protein SCHPADRAFT_118406 [Schizopora paradoxa]